MKATVLLATPLYPPEGGGPATFAALLEQLLPVHDIEVRTVKFSAVRGRPTFIRHIAYLRMLLAEGKRNGRPQVLLALDPVSVGLPSYIAARLLRIPYMVRVVGDYAWEQGVQRAHVKESLDTFLKKTYFSPLVIVLRLVQSFVARNADAVIVPSKYLGTVVEAWGIPHDRISLIHNGFKREAPGNTEIRRKLGIQGKLVISAGRFVPWKGFEMLADLAEHFAKLDLPVTMLFVGDGPLRPVLEKRAVKAQANLKIQGNVSHRTLLGYLREADVFVLNTAYEGFSHLILEAMSVGVPVVTTAVGGNLELVRDKEEGLLVPFNDREALSEAVRSLLNESTMRSRLILTARRTASQFTEERMGKEYATLIHSFLGNKK